ncbi:MAG: tetratricopeptide repeat protein [Chthoniobacteraceae bacterium]
MKSLRIATFRKFAAAISAAILGSFVCTLFAAPETWPAVAARRPALRKAPPEIIAVPVARPAASDEMADALPTNALAAPDLLLRSEGERKANALVAFTDALIAEDNADTEKALAGYRKVLELDPGYAELAVKVAYDLSRRNDVSAGIQILKDCIKAAPEEPTPHIFLSQLYAKQLKKPDLALKAAEQALAVAPQNFASYLANFELLLAAGDLKKAGALLEKATKSGSMDAKFWVQVGDLYTRLLLKDDGTSQSVDQQKMNAVYRRAGELAGEDATILSRVGDYFVLSRQVKEAILFYLKVIAAPQKEKDPPINNTQDKLARAFIVTQQRDEAIGVLEQMAKENPLRFATFEMLGELYQQKGDFEKAMHNYEHSLLLDTSEWQNYVRLSILLQATKKPAKAVEIMQKARAQFPDVPQVTVQLAVALSAAKQHTAAMTAFAEATAQAESNHEEMLNFAFYFQYGMAAEQAGLMGKAAELFKQSIELDANNAAMAYNYLGYMWVDRGENLDEAGEMIRKALEMEPDNASYRDSLGWYHFKKAEYDKALKELLRAAETIKQEDAVVFDHIADTYQAMSKPAEALQYWQKAIALSAEDKAQADKIAEKIEAAKQKVTSSAPPKAEPAPAPPPGN